MSEDPKQRARDMLLGGETDLKAIASATALSEASVRGLKGSLVRSGELEGKKKTRPEASDDSDIDLSNDETHLAYILKTAKIPGKDVTGILELVDDYGFSAEGIYSALEDQNIRKAIRKKVLTRWSARTDEELPQWIVEELNTTRRGSRERGRGRYLTAEDLEIHSRRREEKTEIRRLSEKVDRLLSGGGPAGGQFTEIRVPIDANGVPCAPEKAVSVRFERQPISSGGGVSLLRKEISDLKEKISSDQIAGLSHQVQELSEKVGQTGSDVSAIVTGVKEVMTSWSESQGGPLARAASPLVDAFGRKVLENYNALSPMTPEMRHPQKDTPSTLVEKLRDQGLVAKLHRRRGGG